MDADRRYTIFVSSTFQDLKEERAELIFSVHRKGASVKCMEFFPSQDRDKWEVITDAMDESQIYVLIIGSKYGSIDKESGISYTEKEFNYAVQHDKYVIAFIKKDYQKTEEYKSQKKCDKDKLDAFIKKVNYAFTPSYWNTKENIPSLFDDAYNIAIQHPKVKGLGWMKESLFPGFLGIDSLSEYNFDDGRLRAKLDAIKNAESICIVVHTGCFYFSSQGYNKEIFGLIEQNLAKGKLNKLQVILLHPYTLSGLLIAQEGDEDKLQAELVNKLLNKIIVAYPETIDDKLKDAVFALVSADMDNDFYIKFRQAVKGVQKLITSFSDKVELKLLPAEMTMSLLLTDKECFIEPYASPMAGKNETKTFELHIANAPNSNSVYNNMVSHFKYLWDVSNVYNIKDLDDKKNFYIERFKKTN